MSRRSVDYGSSDDESHKQEIDEDDEDNPKTGRKQDKWKGEKTGKAANKGGGSPKSKKKADNKWRKYHDNVSQKLALERLHVAVIQRRRSLVEEAMTECRDVGLYDCNEYKEAERQLQVLELAKELESACERKNAVDIRQSIDAVRSEGYEEELHNELIHAVYVLKRAAAAKQGQQANRDRTPLTMDRNTVCEIRRYQQPSDSLHAVMQAVLLLFGHDEGLTEKWSEVKKLCNPSDERGIYRRLLVFDTRQVEPEIAARAKEILVNSGIDIDKLRRTSSGAASFYIWSMGIIEEVERANKEKQQHDSDDEDDEKATAGNKRGEAKPANLKRQREIFAEKRRQEEEELRRLAAEKKKEDDEARKREEAALAAKQKQKSLKNGGEKLSRKK